MWLSQHLCDTRHYCRLSCAHPLLLYSPTPPVGLPPIYQTLPHTFPFHTHQICSDSALRPPLPSPLTVVTQKVDRSTPSLSHSFCFPSCSCCSLARTVRPLVLFGRSYTRLFSSLLSTLTPTHLATIPRFSHQHAAHATTHPPTLCTVAIWPPMLLPQSCFLPILLIKSISDDGWALSISCAAYARSFGFYGCRNRRGDASSWQRTKAQDKVWA